ncbi:MAG: bifunctional phosphoribosylaminoimidazolecarboxamide formyltransferase/IMP cyclohydrolase [Gemmataceae bacterium]|nr:bifunctional phosphoribosylaminoimidazolecarboxamide formyltransferase/IMP cyclohydrolase [Gemmataceae bacterium]
MEPAIRHALLSVTDKTGLVELAQALQQRYGVELWASGGTRRHLEQAGVNVRDITSLTQFPEILDGRVKTLHPAIYGGLLARRDNPEHLAQLQQHGLFPIDLVVCNLYPFEQVVARSGVPSAEVIENIDIGGPCLIRAAAKNYDSVAVLIDPVQYGEFLQVLGAHGGRTPRDYRLLLATAAFQRVLQYDAAIARWFVEQQTGHHPSSGAVTQKKSEQNSPAPQTIFPEWFVWQGQLVQRLRYGENPHQQAALYQAVGPNKGLVHAEQLHGKELSYNNWLDLDAAWQAVEEFDRPACVIIKHTNPCGAAVAGTLEVAFRRAWEGDPLSAFGGIVACNCRVDAATAAAITEPAARRFIECLIAPDYEPDALEMLRRWKENVRLLRLPTPLAAAVTASVAGNPTPLTLRSIRGGLLVQTTDTTADDPLTWRVVTQRTPTTSEREALLFAWRVCKHVKSNAIVLARPISDTEGWEVVGVGAGHTSRVDAVHQAVRKAGTRATGAVLASDAFFPFADNVEVAAAAGITAIVQPGGSVRDADSIAAADRYGLAMLFTGVRHFRH